MTTLQSAFPHDPDLDPIRPQAEAQAAPAAAPGAAARPVIAPAEPDRWTKVVPLEFPVTVDGVLLTQITLRRVSGGEVTALLMEDDQEQSINRRARALVAGVHPDVLEGLWADDLVNVLDAARPFLPRALQGADLLEVAADVMGLASAAEPG
jgi:hypothetical protein